jgi:hypothetical protein
MTQVKCASPVVYTGGRRGEYIRFKGVHVPETDDGSLPDTTHQRLVIGDPVHGSILDILEPTEKMKNLIEEHKHLIENVSCALQIRRCGLSKSPNVNNDPGKNNNFCTDETLLKFYDVLERSDGPVFVSSDCYETKMAMYKKFPEKVRVLDGDPTHINSDSDVDPWVSMTEFFLLSMCPTIYMTGGSKDMTTFSTFGYMAAVYGRKKCVAIFNDE